MSGGAWRVGVEGILRDQAGVEIDWKRPSAEHFLAELRSRKKQIPKVLELFPMGKQLVKRFGRLDGGPKRKERGAAAVGGSVCRRLAAAGLLDARLVSPKFSSHESRHATEGCASLYEQAVERVRDAIYADEPTLDAYRDLWPALRVYFNERRDAAFYVMTPWAARLGVKGELFADVPELWHSNRVVVVNYRRQDVRVVALE